MAPSLPSQQRQNGEPRFPLFPCCSKVYQSPLPTMYEWDQRRLSWELGHFLQVVKRTLHGINGDYIASLYFHFHLAVMSQCPSFSPQESIRGVLLESQDFYSCQQQQGHPLTQPSVIGSHVRCRNEADLSLLDREILVVTWQGARISTI